MLFMGQDTRYAVKKSVSAEGAQEMRAAIGLVIWLHVWRLRPLRPFLARLQRSRFVLDLS
jgi:hypothetical protein